MTTQEQGIGTELIAEIDEAIGAVFRELGAGFLETVYIRALAIELFKRRLNVAREVPVTIYYQGVTVGTYRADLMVGELVVVAVIATPPQNKDRTALRNYLRGSNKEYGVLASFGEELSIETVRIPASE